MSEYLTDNDRLPVGTMCATVGLFDGVHMGHRRVFNMVKLQAAACGLKPLVVTFTPPPQHVLRPDHMPVKLLMSVQQRVKAIKKAGIDTVIVLNFDEQMAALTAAQFIGLLRDNYGVSRLIMGYNNLFGSDLPVNFDDYSAIGAAEGVKVLQASKFPGLMVSSSIIRIAVQRQGAMRLVSMMMDSPLTIAGTVVKGRQVGSTIGFPTANVKPECDYQLLPAIGAYSVLVTIDDADKIVLGMAAVGHHPTTGHSEQPTIEVNLFDYDGTDLYGHRLAVKFIDCIRMGEEHFDNLDALRDRLECDRNIAKQQLTKHITNK